MRSWQSYPVTELASPDIPSALRHHKYDVTRAWLRGDSALLRRDGIAIVGSRDAADEATWFAGRLATTAVARGLVVVSGGARGVDLAAHLAAMNGGGQTLVVLGTAINKPYPASHHAALERVLATGGAWLSETPPDAPYSPGHFVKRNRLIVALSMATVVVSARRGSGALTTAMWARKWPRPLGIVTGAPWDAHTAGSRELLHRARAIASEQDFSTWLDELGVRSSASAVTTGVAPATGTLREWAQRMRMPELAAAGWLARGELEGWAIGLGSGRYLVSGVAPSSSN